MIRPKTAPRETTICPICGTKFVSRISRRRKYCSLKCVCRANQLRYAANRKKAKCELCGKIFEHIPCLKPRFCGIKCANTFRARKTAKKRGKQLRGVPTGKGNSYVKENGRHQHRLVMERHLKRKLRTDEVVHHIDGDKHNNDVSNLIVMTQGEHAKLHHTK